MLMLKICITSIIQAISTVRQAENECIFGRLRTFWKSQEVSQSCNMLQLGVERCDSISPVCRYVLTIINSKILYKSDEPSLTVAHIAVSLTLK